MDNSIIVAIITATATVVASVIAYLKERKLRDLQNELDKKEQEAKEAEEKAIEQNLKLGALHRLLDFTSFNEIRSSVDRIFLKTKADRFMILFAMNGTHDFRVISVIFEQHKNPEWSVNAIIRYRDVEIDEDFKSILREAEHKSEIEYDISTMKPQLLKNFWVIEGVKHAKMRFLHRHHIDEKNDVVIYSTIATHENSPFTDIEGTIIKTEYEGSIQHTIKTYI